MFYKRKFLLLTKSSKDGGFCIAGWIFNKQKALAQWIRLVKDRYGADIKCYDYNSFFDKREILDIIEVEYETIDDVFSIQTENRLLKTATFLDRISFDEFDSWRKRFTIDNANLLNSTREFLTPYEAQSFKKSLMIAEVDGLCLYKNNKNKTKARFFYGGKEYSDYSVTDPNFFKIIKERPFPNEKCKIILSIPEKPMQGTGLHYKLIAKIFSPETERVLEDFKKNLFITTLKTGKYFNFPR